MGLCLLDYFKQHTFKQLGHTMQKSLKKLQFKFIKPHLVQGLGVAHVLPTDFKAVGVLGCGTFNLGDVGG